MRPSRRRFVSAGIGSLILSQTSTAVAAAEIRRPAGRTTTSSIKVEVLQSASISSYSADFSDMHTMTAPTFIRLTSVEPVPAGVIVHVEYDRRVFAEGPALVLDDGRPRTLPAPVTEINRDVARASVHIPTEIGTAENSVRLALPVTPRVLFPRENLGRPADVIVEVQPPDRPGSRNTLSRTTDASGVQAWGIAVSGSWATTRVSDGSGLRTYRVPSRVRVDSVGPHAVPAGLSVVVEADANVVSSFNAIEVRLNEILVSTALYTVETFSGDGVTRIELLFGPEIPSSQALTVTLEPTLRDVPAVGTGIVFARVYANASGSAQRPERATGSRMAIAISNSGEPLAPTDAEGGA